MRRTTLMMASHQARDAPQVDITNIYGSYGILIHNKAKQSSERAVLIFPPEGDVLFVKNSRIYDSVPTDAFLSLTIAEKPDVQIMSTDMTTVLRVYSLSIGLDALATHDGTDSRHVLVGSEYEARAIGEIINHLIAKQRISDIIQAQPIEFSGLIELGVDGVWEPKWTIVAGDKLMLFDEKRSTRPNSVISLAGIESIQRLGENRTIVPDRLTAEARRTFGQSNRPRVKRIIVDDPAQSGLSLTLRQIEELEGGYEEVELPVLEDSSEKYPIMSCIRHSVDVDIFQFINDDVCTAWLDAISAAKDAVTAHFNEIVRLELEEEKERIRATNQERLDAIQREKEGPEPIPLPEDLQHIYLSDCTSKVPLIDHPTSVIIVQDAYSPISTFDGQIQPTVPSSLAGKLIRFVAQGAGHHVAINSKNQLYSWGVGSENQLGLGPSKTEQSIPMLMTSLIKERIISVACGTHHTLALSDSGSLFAWGKNTNGQLGVDIEEANSGYPRQVDIPPIRYIAAGGNTSFALSQDGHLYTWGSNSNSVMAIPTAETRVNIKKPTLHPTLNGPIRQISISPDGSSGIAIVEPYSVASLKSKYDVWTWGSNVQGQLGLGPGAEAFRAKITPVKQLHRFGVNVVQVAMGIGCAACITDTGDLYTWGRAGSSGHTVPTDFPTLIPHLNNIQSITVTSSGFIVTDSNYKPHVLGLGASCITPLGISPQYQVLSASSSPVSGETVFIVEGALVGNTSVQSTAVAPQAALDPRQVQNFAPRQKNQGGALPSQSLPPPSFGNPQSFSASSASQHDSLNDRVKMTRGKLQGGALPRLAPPPPPPPGMGGMDLGGFNIGGIEMPTALADDMYRSDRNVNVLMSNARNRQGRGREVDSQKLEHDVLAAASLMLNMHLVAGGTDREGKDIDKEAFQKALNKSTAPPPPPEPMPAPAPMQMTQQSVNLPPPPPPSDDMDLPPPPPPSFSINNQAQFQDLPPPPPPGSDFSALPPPPGPSDFDLPPMPATTTTTKAPVKKSGFVNKHFATKAPVAASSVPVFDMDMDFPPPPM